MIFTFGKKKLMGIDELKGSLLETIRDSNDEDLLQDLKSRVDIDFFLGNNGIASILGGVDTEELITQANEPNSPYNSISELDFKLWLKKWKSS